MCTMRINAAIVLLFGALCSTAANARQDKSGKTVWDAVYSEAQAKRGETAYGSIAPSATAPISWARMSRRR